MLTPLPEILPTYRRKFPKVHLQLHESNTASVVRSLLNGSLDAGFLRDGNPISGLETQVLFSESLIAIVPATHPLASFKPISAARLRYEPFVFVSPNASSHAYEKTIAPCVEQGFPSNVVQDAPQWLTVLRLVGAGLGVTIAPNCVHQVAASNVVCLRLRDTQATSDLKSAYRTTENRAIVSTFTRQNFHPSWPVS